MNNEACEYLPCLFYNMHRLLQCLVAQSDFPQIKWFFRDYVLTKWLYNGMLLQIDSPPGKSNILMKTTFHVKNTFRRLSNKHSSSANCRNKWCQNAYKWSVSGKSPNCQAACLRRFWGHLFFLRTGASLLLRDPSKQVANHWSQEAAHLVMKQPYGFTRNKTSNGVLKNQAWQLPLRLLKGLKGMKLLTQWPVHVVDMPGCSRGFLLPLRPVKGALVTCNSFVFFFKLLREEHHV